MSGPIIREVRILGPVVAGRDLRVGDVIECLGQRETIVELRPYRHALATEFRGGGACIAKFATGRAITIGLDDTHAVFNR